MNPPEAVTAFIDLIAPNIHFSGRRALTLAVSYMYQRYRTNSFEDIRVTKDIYPLVARDMGRSLGTVEKAIYRALDFCWMNGQNEALHQIIGKKLPVRPKPELLLRYSAYYCYTGKPYHQAKESSLALLF